MIIGADSTDRDEGNPFWDFSLALYGSPGVAEACLGLQDDAGLDVNLVLYACYLANQGLALNPAQAAAVDQCCSDWRDTVVQPVRALRRELKETAGHVSELLLAAELAGERQQQNMIWQWHVAQALAPDQTNNTDALLRTNLACVATLANGSAATVYSFALLVAGMLPITLAQC